MWLVFKKELLELSRDRKTLIFTILFPTLIIPLLMGGFVYFSKAMFEKRMAETLTYAVIGADRAPELVELLSKAKNFQRVDGLRLEDINSAIREERVRLVFEIPDTVRAQLAAGKKGVIRLHYNSASSVAKIVTKRVQPLIEKYTNDMQKMLLAERGISKLELDWLLKPVEVEKVSIANKRESFGEAAGGLIAYFLIIFILSGAMYPALDLGVGEKERGTLETLLLNPIPRWQIALAKYLVIFVAGFLAVLLAIVSIGIWGVLIGQAMVIGKAMEIIKSIGVTDLVMLIVMVMPVAAIFAAILLSISVYARNFKEAQNYSSPLVMVIIIPVMAALVPGIELNWITAMVPITNMTLAMKELIKGTIDYTYVAAIFGSTFVLALLALWFAVHWFNREEVLFRS